MPFLFQYRLVSMLIVHVHVRVKPEFVESFRRATLENARQSIAEPGIARFDVLKQASDPTRFVLAEAYRTPDAPALHRATTHYKIWRDTVEEMMAEPRIRVELTNVFPEESAW
jgi:(4S)-4-hydroxy-5-phosphonooxypentane-2,3-dione isomerase